MKRKLVPLAIMILLSFILWDSSLHWVQLFHVEKSYPLYPYFPDRTFYDLFWAIAWGVMALCILILGTIKIKGVNKHGLQ